MLDERESGFVMGTGTDRVGIRTAKLPRLEGIELRI